MKKLAFILGLIALTSCSMPQQGKLYNLSTGQVTPVTYSYNGTGKGSIQFVVDGKILKGEYLTLASAGTWGSIYGAYGGVVANTTQRGSAVAADGQGLVLQCEYTTDAFSGGGSGFCKDNNNVAYRVTF